MVNMKNKINFKTRTKIGLTVFIAVLAALITALTMFAFPVARADEGLQQATLLYADEEETIVIGIEKDADGFNAEEPYKVSIPSTVKKIGKAAFANESNLTSVVFEGNSVEEIGSSAFSATGITEIYIPASVKKIGYAAFAGAESLAQLTFDTNISLKEIEGFAFGQTGLTVVELPSDLEKLGEAAFAQNSLTLVTLPDSLEYVGKGAFAGNKCDLAINLPDNVNTVYGEYVFGKEPPKAEVKPNPEEEEDEEEDGLTALADDIKLYLIAKNKASYERLIKTDAIEDAEAREARELFVKTYKGDFTYLVTIEYNYLGSVIASEQRLYGKTYNEVLKDGKWQIDEGVTTLCAAFAGMEWYKTENATSNADKADVAYVNDLLAPEQPKQGASAEEEDQTPAAPKQLPDVIILYAFEKSASASKLFIARSDIEYNGKEYAAGTALNSLLINASDKITPSMTVTIASYTDVNGKVVDKMDAAFPTAIKNAGVYGIDVDGTVFNLTVGRKKVNLGDYNNGLAWRLKSIGTHDVNADLLSANVTMLYLYTRVSDGSVYPTRRTLTDNEIDARELNSEYTTVLVKHSIASYYGGVILTVGLNGDINGYGAGDLAYTMTYSESGKSASDIGMYTAGVTLKANDNYMLVLDGSDIDMTERGISIVVSKDGKTATVNKQWYVVDSGNQLVSEESDEYKIDDRIYGDNSVTAAPTLKYGDVITADYGSALDPVTLKLEYKGEFITDETGNDEFSRNELTYYINAAMPAGEYSLYVIVGEVITDEDGKTVDSNVETGSVYHAAFETMVQFTVISKAIPTIVTDKIDGLLRNRTFTYEWDGKAHYYDESIAQDIESALSYTATSPRTNTVWENEKYDDMFGGFGIMLNLARMQNDLYYSAEAMPIKPTDPDKYILFYKVVAPNYADSVSELEEGQSRTDFSFEVINVREIEIPQAYAKTYTGSLLVSDLVDTLIYTVTTNDGGVDVGEYDVVITFREPDYYMWQGQTINDKTADMTVKFSITAATNRWDVDPGVKFWVEGSYDATENAVVGAARFGNAVIVITDINDTVVYNSATGINELASLKAGVYRLSATVSGSDNYDPLTFSAFVQVFEKPGLPWWAILLIAVGSLLVAAIIILILWKKGVFQILTSKLMLAIRTKATVDATIAAVRANKMALAARESIAEANAREAAEERAKARKEAAEAERNKTAEEKAAELEAKAQAESERAERIKARAETMRAKASEMKDSAASEPEAEQVDQVVENAEEKVAEPLEKPETTEVAPKPKKKSTTKKKSDGPKNI